MAAKYTTSPACQIKKSRHRGRAIETLASTLEQPLTRLEIWDEYGPVPSVALEVDSLQPVAPSVWETAQRELALQMTRATYQVQVKPVRLVGIQPSPDGQPDTIVLLAPSASARDWLTHRLAEMVRRSLSKVLGREIEVAFLSPDTEVKQEGSLGQM